MTSPSSGARPEAGSNPDAVKLGAAVRHLREQYGYSQDDLLRLAGPELSRSPLQDLETGRRMSRGRALRAIARAFEMDLPALRKYAEELAAEQNKPRRRAR